MTPQNTAELETQQAKKLYRQTQQMIKSYREQAHNSDSLVVNVKRPDSDEAVHVHPHLAQKLKTHQIQAIRFMWTNTVVSLQVLLYTVMESFMQ